MSGWDIGSDLIHITLVYATALMFGALGGLWSERSGVVNIAIEGMMTIGAFTGAVVTYFAGSPWIGFIAAAIAGAVFALPHAVASVTYKADQTISGVALNFLAVGLGLYLTKLIFNGQGQSPNLASGGTNLMISKVHIPFLSDIPFVGHAFFESYPTTYIAIFLMAVTWYILYKTPWGLRIRAVGEHPKAADTAGVNVYLVRYMAVLTSGAFAAMGGATLALTTTASFSHSTVAGQGYIALAALIFGKWHPVGAVAAASFFGIVTAVKFLLPYVGLGHVPLDIISMLPYALTLIVLVSFVGRATAPLASGVPYEKGSR